MQKKKNIDLEILRQVLYMYLHQIKGVEFICDRNGQTFLSTLYVSFARLYVQQPRDNY